jgi:hypothetical protein
VPKVATTHSRDEADSFIGPLNGKTTTFLVEGRGTNLSFASSIMSLLAVTGDSCAVFDLDALYASNSDTIFGTLPTSFNLSTAILVPDPNSRVETDLPQLFHDDPRVVIVDSLNTFHHLLSSDGGSRTRKLSFAVASLSYLARTGRKCVIFTMYRREGFGRPGAGRSISSLSDVTASVEAHDSTLSFRCDRGTAWPSGRYSIRVP